MATNILVIAGTDPTGQAGLSIDLQTIYRHGCQASIAVTAINVQNEQCVSIIQPSSALLLEEQIKCALQNCDIKIAKIGMIYSIENAHMLGHILQKYPLTSIFDPVLEASSGYSLSENGLASAIINYILPHISILTPNLPELAILCGTQLAQTSVEAIEQANYLINKYNAKAILIKGGHSKETEAIDILCRKNSEPHYFSAPRLGKQKRGTGCALSSAIAANLDKNRPMIEAITQAKQYIMKYIDE